LKNLLISFELVYNSKHESWHDPNELLLRLNGRYLLSCLNGVFDNCLEESVFAISFKWSI